MVSLPDGEKNFEDIFIRFGATPERDGQTDGQTDGRTDRQTLHDSKDRAYASHRAVKMKAGIRKNSDFLQLWFE